VEFGVLCRSYDHLRGPILERMPPIPSDKLNKRETLNDGLEGDANNVEDLLLADISGDQNTAEQGHDSV
jgi:hypothetical protein